MCVCVCVFPALFFVLLTCCPPLLVSYWVDPLHQGRGVATECLRQMTDLAFGLVTARELLGNKSEEETELFPVEMNKCRLFVRSPVFLALSLFFSSCLIMSGRSSQIRPENAASQALARKVGYVHEATLRDEYSLRGVLSDAELFTKLRREHLPVRSEDTREEADGAS